MKTSKQWIQISIVSLVIGLGASLAGATTFTWNGAVNGNWSNPGNWIGNAAPTSTGLDNITLTSDGFPPANQDIPGLYINQLTLFTNVVGFTVGGNAIAVKYLHSYNAVSIPQTNTFNCPVNMASASGLGVGGAGVFLVFNNSLGETNGSQSLIAEGGGIVVLAGTNTFSGGVKNVSGKVIFYNDLNLGPVPGSYVSNFFGNGGVRTAIGTGAFTRVTIHANRGWQVTTSYQGFSAGTGVKLVDNAPIVGVAGWPGFNYNSAQTPVGEIWLGGNSTNFLCKTYVGYGKVILTHSNALGNTAGRILEIGVANVDVNGHSLPHDIVYENPNTGYDFQGRLLNSDSAHPATISGTVAVPAGDTSVNGNPFGGAGDLILTGVVSGGTVQKVGNGALTFKGANTLANNVWMQCGGLTLDYTVQNNDKVNASGAFYYNQGTLRLVGSDAGATAQSLGSLSFGNPWGASRGADGFCSIRLESGMNQNLTLSANAITYSVGLSALDVTTVNSGSGLASLTTTNPDGLLAGGAATWNQSTWAKVVSGVVTGMADGDYVTTFAGGTATTHVDVPAGATTLNANTTEQTLRFNAPAGSSVTLSNTVVLNLTGSTAPNFPGILMTANSGAANINGPGTITPVANAPFCVHQYSANALTLAAALNASSGFSLVKCGPGELIVTGTNSFASGTYVYGGTLTVNNLANAGANCAIGTSTDLPLGNATFKYIGGAVSQNHRVVLTGNAAIDASGSGLLVFTAPTNVTIRAFRGNDSSLRLTGTGSGRMDGALDLHMGGVVKDGSGTWTIGGTQPYTGNTIVSNGTLRLTNNCMLARSLTVTAGGTLAGSAMVAEDVVMAGTRRVEIRGDADYDRLTVGYDTTLGGNLDLVEMNGYRMPANFNMSILTSGGTVNGAFTTVTGGFVVTPSADGRQLLLTKRYPGFMFYVK